MLNFYIQEINANICGSCDFYEASFGPISKERIHSYLTKDEIRTKGRINVFIKIDNGNNVSFCYLVSKKNKKATLENGESFLSDKIDNLTKLDIEKPTDKETNEELKISFFKNLLRYIIFLFLKEHKGLDIKIEKQKNFVDSHYIKIKEKNDNEGIPFHAYNFFLCILGEDKKFAFKKNPYFSVWNSDTKGNNKHKKCCPCCKS